MQQAEGILRGYFGMNDLSDKVPWPIGDVEHVYPLTGHEVLNGFTSQSQYKSLMKGLEWSNPDTQTRNHFVYLVAALMDATPDEVLDKYVYKSRGH